MPQKPTVAYFEYGRVFPQPNVDDAPLTNNAPPAAPEPAAPPTPRNVWAALAVLWCICHLAIVGAVCVTLTVDAEGFCTSPLQPLGAVPAALALWAVTLTMRHKARRGNR
jgi:hypothetical protein